MRGQDRTGQDRLWDGGAAPGLYLNKIAEAAAQCTHSGRDARRRVGPPELQGSRAPGRQGSRASSSWRASSRVSSRALLPLQGFFQGSRPATSLAGGAPTQAHCLVYLHTCGTQSTASIHVE